MDHDLSAWGPVARTSLISDAMDMCGLPGNAAGGFRLLGARRVAIGRAVTMQQALDTGEGGTGRQGEIALAAPAGHILAIGLPEGCEAATWGEGHSMRALIAGLSGVVMAGATRDAGSLQGGTLPVLCRQASPLRSKERLVTSGTGCPVQICGVRICPGDIICFDDDGLVAVPAAHEAQVLERALRHLEWETARDQDLQTRLDAARSGA